MSVPEKPDDVPESVWAQAEHVLMETRWQMIPTADFAHAQGLIARAILAAQAEERERCARVAEKAEKRVLDDKGGMMPIWGRHLIAAAIRSKPSA